MVSILQFVDVFLGRDDDDTINSVRHPSCSAPQASCHPSTRSVIHPAVPRRPVVIHQLGPSSILQCPAGQVSSINSVRHPSCSAPQASCHPSTGGLHSAVSHRSYIVSYTIRHPMCRRSFFLRYIVGYECVSYFVGPHNCSRLCSFCRRSSARSCRRRRTNASRATFNTRRRRRAELRPSVSNARSLNDVNRNGRYADHTMIRHAHTHKPDQLNDYLP